MKYVYEVWFKDNALAPNDQDHEWVASFLVDAETPEKAQSWADHLAQGYCTRATENVFLRSEVRTMDDPHCCSVKDWSSSPVVAFGEEASDEKIGW